MILSMPAKVCGSLIAAFVFVLWLNTGLCISKQFI